jgi:hypothetical protein
MAHPLINKRFYEALIHFEDSEEAQDTYYKIMDATVERNGRSYSVRDQILRAYAMLFCDNIGAQPGYKATPEDVEATADRLYIGELRFDPKHWYRMRHHFPVIDEDNYDRFAALVIADLNAGPLHESAGGGEGMLLVGEPNPLTMTAEARRSQKQRKIFADALSPEGDQA